jgi:hypothetical protein
LQPDTGLSTWTRLPLVRHCCLPRNSTRQIARRLSSLANYGRGCGMAHRCRRCSTCEPSQSRTSSICLKPYGLGNQGNNCVALWTICERSQPTGSSDDASNALQCTLAHVSVNSLQRTHYQALPGHPDCVLLHRAHAGRHSSLPVVSTPFD